MDKSVIFAVAGAGKTTLLIAQLNLEKRFLIVTYTENNLNNLKVKIIEKFGYFPSNVRLYSYFTFLYSFCYRPILARRLKTRGINWAVPDALSSRLPLQNRRRYMTASGYLYHNRIAKLLDVEKVMGGVLARVEKFFDHFLVDEVQDFAGHDFNLLLKIAAAEIRVLMLGDFFQHTFDTSRDGSTNGRLHDDYAKYLKRFAEVGVKIDVDSLAKSRRCSRSVCEFVEHQIGIAIQAHSEQDTHVVLVDDRAEAERLYRCDNTVKLFYREHRRYDCYSQNWGGSKGEDHYNDVCVVLNPTTYKAYTQACLTDLPPQTKNKFYVACTRARGNLYFVPERLLKNFKQGAAA